MKKHYLAFMFLLGIVFLASCSSNNDNDYGEDLEYTAINMLNESNGKTKIVSGDIYIDNANNFHSHHFRMFNASARKNITNLERVEGLGNGHYEVSAASDNYYDAINNDDYMQFPSGQFAAKVGVRCSRINLVSVVEENGVTKGAIVRQADFIVTSKEFPSNETIGQMPKYGTFTYTLPNNVEFMMLEKPSNLQIRKEGQQITFEFLSTPDRNFISFLVRKGGVFTELSIELI